jgi:hypothetical protein
VCEQDSTGANYVWALARCVAHHPDFYYANVGDPESRTFYAQRFSVPKGYAIITELTPAEFAEPKLKQNLIHGRPMFNKVLDTLVKDHGLFGALLPTQGGFPKDFQMPKDFLKVLEQRKGPKIKNKKDKFDPHHLFYPLFPDNDKGDPNDLHNDGACMLVPASIKAHRKELDLPRVRTVGASTQRGGRRGYCCMLMHCGCRKPEQ